MSHKPLFAALVAFTSATSLSAQAPTTTHTMQVEEMNTLVHLLEQNALLALIGAVVLMGLLWIFCIIRECTRLKEQRSNGSKALGYILVLSAGLSLFGSSCTVAQRTQAEQYRAAQAAEGRTCPMNQHHDPSNAALNNGSPYAGYSNWYGPSFCKYCGQRIYKARR